MIFETSSKMAPVIFKIGSKQFGDGRYKQAVKSDQRNRGGSDLRFDRGWGSGVSVEVS
jgi:hypothetical protein